MRDESIMWAAATETAERIGRVVSDALRTLSQAGVDAAIVEGSALSAELSDSDEFVRRFASRASLAMPRTRIDEAQRVFAESGWVPGPAQGDLHLLRAAVRHGRHLVFALLDERGRSDGSRRLHPSHPEAVRERNERLSRWRTHIRLTLTRQRMYEDHLGCTVTETFELSIVESAPALATGTVPA